MNDLDEYPQESRWTIRQADAIMSLWKLWKLIYNLDIGDDRTVYECADYAIRVKGWKPRS